MVHHLAWLDAAQAKSHLAVGDSLADGPCALRKEGETWDCWISFPMLFPNLTPKWIKESCYPLASFHTLLGAVCPA